MGVDPKHPGTKQQLMYLLGARAIDVTAVEGYSGSSDGMWVISDPEQRFAPAVVELHSAGSAHPSSCSEAKGFKSLARAHPGLERDSTVAFPLKIFTCLSAYGEGQGELTITRQAPGQVLADLIPAMYDASHAAREDLFSLFEDTGRQLRSFHDRYGKQHGNFQPENVFVDLSERSITFVGLGCMASSLASDDVVRFGEGLRLLSPDYAPTPFLKRCYKRFERGYGGTPPPAPQWEEKDAEKYDDVMEFSEDLWVFGLQELEEMLTWEGLGVFSFLLFALPLFLRRRRSEIKPMD